MIDIKLSVNQTGLKPSAGVSVVNKGICMITNVKDLDSRVSWRKLNEKDAALTGKSQLWSSRLWLV